MTFEEATKDMTWAGKECFERGVLWTLERLTLEAMPMNEPANKNNPLAIGYNEAVEDLEREKAELRAELGEV